MRKSKRKDKVVFVSICGHEIQSGDTVYGRRMKDIYALICEHCANGNDEYVGPVYRQEDVIKHITKRVSN